MLPVPHFKTLVHFCMKQENTPYYRKVFIKNVLEQERFKFEIVRPSHFWLA